MSEPTRFHTPQPSGFTADVPPASGEHAKDLARDVQDIERMAAAESIEESAPASEPEPELTPPGERLPPAKPELLVGCTVDGRYKVEAVLGEGGMGVVYRCRHKMIDKLVAMKVLRADLARDAEVTERFLQEAKAASAIGHEHIIDIHDFGHLPDGSTYFVMEYLDGQSLSDAAPPGQCLPVARIAHISKQIAEGLAAAHEAGIVHRDLKPDNVFLTTRGTDADFVKILDFGIAKVSTSPTGQLTRAGAVFGTPHYMSPEQSSGAPVDHRGDIYSLGVMMYEFACGKVPFDADNFMGILTQHMYKTPAPLRSLVAVPQDVPAGFDAIVLKCLSKRPEQRYPTMKELILDIEVFESGGAPRAVREMLRRSSNGFSVPANFWKTQRRLSRPPGGPKGSGRGRWPLVAGALGVAAGVALTAATFATGGGRAAPIAKEPAAAAPLLATAPVPSTKVAIAVEPIDAEVFRGVESLGTSPVVVEVLPNQEMSLDVRKAGYVSQTLRLDGSAPKVSVRLERLAPSSKAAKPQASAPRAPVATASAAVHAVPVAQKPKTAASSSDIVNPWAR